VAAILGQVEILDKLWEWANKVLKTDELKNNLLLAKDGFKKTVMHQATNRGNVQIVERIWNFAKEQIRTEELNKLFLAQEIVRRTGCTWQQFRAK
jgi:endo-1,4-beta-D-glucanase Y